MTLIDQNNLNGTGEKTMAIREDNPVLDGVGNVIGVADNCKDAIRLARGGEAKGLEDKKDLRARHSLYNPFIPPVGGRSPIYWCWVVSNGFWV